MGHGNIFNNPRPSDIDWTNNINRSSLAASNSDQIKNDNILKLKVKKDLQQSHFTFGNQKQFAYLK